MKKTITRILSLLCAAAMTVSFTACSSGSKTESSTETKSDAIVKNIGTGSSMAPFCYLNEDGELQGYDIAVMKELDERLEDYEFNIQYMDFSALIVALDAGQLDMVSHQLVKSEARKEKYLFPEQYYCLSPMSLVVTPDSNIKTLEDMAGKKINGSPSSYEYTMIESWNADHPGKEIVQIAVSDLSTADGYKQVENGTVDAALTYRSTFEAINKDLGLDLTLTDVVMCEDTYQMFGSDEEEFVAAVDAELRKMLDDGTLSKISEEYFGEDIFSLYADKIFFAASK
ncbi:MAG: transporter substrate-binding domain-containing protein [Clostridia bacterium]|nr:transporter substrate-binding domain-containing protein [Clostridia bacterium]